MRILQLHRVKLHMSAAASAQLMCSTAEQWLNVSAMCT
jgi:hypothetical protein